MAAALPYIAAATGIAGAVGSAKAAGAAQDQANQAKDMQKYALANAKQYQPIQNWLQGVLQNMMGMGGQTTAPTAPTKPTAPARPSRSQYGSDAAYRLAKQQYETDYQAYKTSTRQYNKDYSTYQTQLKSYNSQIPNQEMPSWMQVDWTKPYTDEQLNTMRQSNIQSAQDISDSARATSYADLVRRGAIGEGMTSSVEDNSAFRNELFGRQMQNQAALDTQNAVIGRGDQLRGEQNTNWLNLVNMVRNNPSTQGLQGWAQMAQNQAGAYGQQAGGILNNLGQIAANWPQSTSSATPASTVTVNTGGSSGYYQPWSSGLPGVTPGLGTIPQQPSGGFGLAGQYDRLPARLGI